MISRFMLDKREKSLFDVCVMIKKSRNYFVNGLYLFARQSKKLTQYFFRSKKLEKDLSYIDISS